MNFEFEAIRELTRKALTFAEQKGTEVQRDDMVGVVSVLAHYSGELEDFTTGKRDPAKHPHHKIEDLEQTVIDGRRTVGQICREILKNSK